MAVRRSDLIHLDGKDKVPGRGVYKTWTPDAIQRVCFGDGLGFSGARGKTIEQILGKASKQRGALATSTRVPNLEALSEH